MRHLVWAILLATALPSAALADAPPPAPLEGGDKKLPPLKVTVDRSKVDLEKHRLEVKLSRTAKSVKIKVLGDSGDTLAEEEHDFEGKPADTPLIVTWTPKKKEPVARIEVFGYDTEGYYAGVAIVPWSVNIPHQEVLFDTDKAVIKPGEKPKLEDSFQKIEDAIQQHKELGAIKLFIAGRTDTVGTPAHNVELSRKRAKAIAGWFKKRGIKIPIFWEGFGEGVPVVKTKDEVDEPRNRRVDYILAIEPPATKSGSAPAWKKS
jgi:outer membrane protein OmpA-like peptidoglycan-associated protein